MALKGTLKDFSLADILQLIGIQRKTGVLNLHSEHDRISISFLQGSIVSAESAKQRLEERVAAVLVKWGHCIPEEVEEARQTQQQTLEQLWTILLRQQSVTDDQVRQVLQLQVERIIYPVFRWTDGEYSFIQEAKIDYDSNHITPIHSETVLMEGVRMMDEWPLLERKIRSPELVLSRAPVDGQVVVNEEAGAEKDSGQIRISREEYAIYNLVNGVRTVSDIYELSPNHDFTTASVICNLLGLGLITQSSGGGRITIERLESGPAEARSSRRPTACTALWLAMAVILAITVPNLDLNPLNRFTRGIGDSERMARLRMLRETTQTHRLVEQLEAYRLEQGFYPESLSELVAGGFASENSIISMSGEPYAYLYKGEGFTLAPHSGSLVVPESATAPVDPEGE